MTIPEAEARRARVCTDKDRYDDPSEARWAAREHGLRAYRCSFSGIRHHWHIGHPLSVDGMRLLATAIRVIHQGTPVAVPQRPAA